MRAVWVVVIISQLQHVTQSRSRELVCQESNPREPVSLDLSPSKVRSDDALEVEFCVCPQDNIPSWILSITFLRAGDTLASVRMYHNINVNGQQSDVDTLQMQCQSERPVEASNPWSYNDQLPGIRRLFKLKMNKSQISVGDKTGSQEEMWLTEVCKLKDLRNISVTIKSDPCCGRPSVSFCCFHGLRTQRTIRRWVWVSCLVAVGAAVLCIQGVMLARLKKQFDELEKLRLENVHALRF
ncbi:hypothetical protein OTU49_006025 [Cherax quadricarinatus]|uniref:Uncharacterized protein n=2 Tax=Cherax quadricarinatus TaxID=27406 RepID=A0AAW0X7W3_CHEQU